MSDKRVVNWKGVKEIGVPYSRAHVWRLMEPTIKRSSGSQKKGNYKEWVEPNLDPFPRCMKAGQFRNSPPMWWRDEIIDWLDRRSKTRLT